MHTTTSLVVVVLFLICSYCYCFIHVAPLPLLRFSSSVGLHSVFHKERFPKQQGLLSLAFAKYRAGDAAGGVADTGSGLIPSNRGRKVNRRKVESSQHVLEIQPIPSKLQEVPVETARASKRVVKSGDKNDLGPSGRSEKPQSSKLPRVRGRVPRLVAKPAGVHLGGDNDEDDRMTPMDVLIDGEMDAYLDTDTLDTMLRALTHGSAKDKDATVDFETDLALSLGGAGGSALRRGSSALLGDGPSAAGADGFEGDERMAPGVLLAGTPEGDDDLALGEDSAEPEGPDSLLELGAEDLGIDLDDAEGEVEEGGAEDDEPPARKLRGRQRVVQILAASQRGAGGSSGSADGQADPDPDSFSAAEMEWLPNIYLGGRPKQSPLPASLLLLGEEYRGEPMLSEASVEGSSESESEVDELVAAGDVFAEQVEHRLYGHDEPAPWRVQIVSVVTNSSRNSTALDCVNRVYDFIKAGTGNDPRVAFQIICLTEDEDTPFEELEDVVQMWLESYNTYHLVDGAAMKEAWGGIMPDILLSPRNLQAILDRVLWALEEDRMDGALLTPRLRRLRFRGGAQEMSTGFNTEHLESEFSVVSVR